MATTMTSDAEDRSTWQRNGQPIRRGELLRLIEENGSPEWFDLRGAVFVGDGPEDDPLENPIDLSREALEPLAAAYRHQNGGQDPPWLSVRAAINLRGAQLQRANLFGAQLQEADVADAQLQGADLKVAQLQGANLFGAQLQEASLESARLKGACLTRAQLQGANLSYAQLLGTDLSRAGLQGVDMYEVGSLGRARWTGALLDQTRITRETLGAAIGDEVSANRTKTS